ncbi:MliC family protein [Halomonas denitrificans]|uniref:MliC family protein n=1 Tax=Halomonas TaxID=2745 RepID=UPI001A8CC2BA|nr:MULTISPECIES: MliC family protein [Halomonas]MED5295772.1 MliC family protein [Pseudomonadota bacterium]MBN8410943.1 MliC family protein [Halomonas litopenaei]MBY5969490.1 MliC family protein [Halomonas denitrificans]MBY5985119.1 MliC family protein [Halomonas sp. DP5Y7-2]MBY6208177.1 MliC family protein [Halomonas sp. DP3Y7-2]
MKVCWIPAAALALLVAGCAGTGQQGNEPPADEAASPSADYICQDGSQFTIVFDSPDSAEVRMHGDRYPLERQPVASGMSYASENGQHVFRGKGNEATWTIGRRMPVNCEVSG